VLLLPVRSESSGCRPMLRGRILGISNRSAETTRPGSRGGPSAQALRLVSSKHLMPKTLDAKRDLERRCGRFSYHSRAHCYGEAMRCREDQGWRKRQQPLHPPPPQLLNIEQQPKAKASPRPSDLLLLMGLAVSGACGTALLVGLAFPSCGRSGDAFSARLVLRPGLAIVRCLRSFGRTRRTLLRSSMRHDLTCFGFDGPERCSGGPA
jgi:hypothetical protein